MTYAADCMYCGRPLEGKRAGALFCKDSHRKRFDRYQKKIGADGHDPPVSRTSALNESRADRAFRSALAAESTRAAPLTDEERQLLAAQRRNPGVLLPQLHQRLLDHELERRRALAEEAVNPIKVEDPYDATTLGSRARRAQQSRRNNRPVNGNLYALRPPVQSGPYPGDEPQCIQAPVGRNTPRSMLPW